MKNQVNLDEAVIELEVEPFETELKLRTAAKNAQKALNGFRRAFNDFKPLFLKLEQMDIGLDFCMRSGDINISFVGDGDRLGAVWGELRRHGYLPDGHPKKGDTSFVTWFRKGDYPHFWLSFASTLCRRVQVGTRTEEVPVYEVFCGELPELNESRAKEISHDIPF